MPDVQAVGDLRSKEGDEELKSHYEYRVLEYPVPSTSQRAPGNPLGIAAAQAFTAKWLTTFRERPTVTGYSVLEYRVLQWPLLFSTPSPRP